MKCAFAPLVAGVARSLSCQNLTLPVASQPVSDGIEMAWLLLATTVVLVTSPTAAVAARVQASLAPLSCVAPAKAA